MLNHIISSLGLENKNLIPSGHLTFKKYASLWSASCSGNFESLDRLVILLKVDLKHWNQLAGSNIVKVGIDLSEFYLSVEWDILAVPATRNEEYYPCCSEPYSGE